MEKKVTQSMKRLGDNMKRQASVGMYYLYTIIVFVIVYAIVWNL